MAIKASANITLVYVSDGTGYTVLLSNESYAFAAGTSAALAGSTSSNVVAYKNTYKVAATITKIGNSAVSGIPRESLLGSRDLQRTYPGMEQQRAR